MATLALCLLLFGGTALAQPTSVNSREALLVTPAAGLNRVNPLNHRTYAQRSSGHRQALLYAATHGSLRNESGGNQAARLPTHYKASRKQAQVGLLGRDEALREAEIRQQTRLRDSFLTGCGIFLILALNPLPE